MLRTLTTEQKHDWKQHLNKVVHAYNVTQHETTGYSPHFLLYGRSPRLPIDLAFRLSPDGDADRTEHHEYVKKWKLRMEEAYILARSKAHKLAERSKNRHDQQRPIRTSLLPGDRVLIKNCVPPGGPGKLQSFYEDNLHIVVAQKRELPVYEVRPEHGNGRTRVLHRNLLCPCDALITDTPKFGTTCTKKVKKVPEQRVRNTSEGHTTQSGDVADSDDEDEVYLPYTLITEPNSQPPHAPTGDGSH
ncbi:uncharacterized protein LOC117118893, partial [Anneissia japonica]|uniref:uncharacterized protein LOC117118893 n=1 Tax=Anneissia japonica TaxID=1529436 RepID=UPI0014258E81